MVASLESLHLRVAEEARDGPDIAARPPHAFGPELAGHAGDEAGAPGLASNEAAARYYLDELLHREDRPTLRAIVEPERMPGPVVENERDLRPLGTHQVRFGQTHRGLATSTTRPYTTC
jgi:bacillolysin